MLGVPPFWNKEKVQPFVGKRVIVTYWSASAGGGQIVDVSADMIGIMTHGDDYGVHIVQGNAISYFTYDKISTIVEDTSTATTQAGLLGNPWAIAAIVLGGALLYNYSKNPKRAE
jgi:hypothetical protein